jgi:hypothetical protein
MAVQAKTGNLSLDPEPYSCILTMAEDAAGSTVGPWTKPSGYTDLITTTHPSLTPSYTYFAAAYKNGSAVKAVAWSSPASNGPVALAIEIR